MRIVTAAALVIAAVTVFDGRPDQPPLKLGVPTARTVRRGVEFRRSAGALAKAEGLHDNHLIARAGDRAVEGQD